MKVAAAPEQRQGIVSIADIFRAKVVDVSKDSLIVEMTGSKTKLEAFINLMGDYEIWNWHVPVLWVLREALMG